MDSSTFLITGGAGFIGSHLTLRLMRDGHTVKVLDNFTSRPRSDFEQLVRNEAGSVEIVQGDIRDPDACRRAVAAAEFVLHHAALASVPGSIARPAECMDTNVLGTTHLLEAAAATGVCRRFVFASSSAIYGDLPPVTKTEDARPEPLSPYASSKLAGELLCRNFTTIFNLPTVSLRYFNVYGQRQDPNGPYAAVIPRFLEAVCAGKEPVIYGDGEQSRDFVFVDDVVCANIRACASEPDGVEGRAFNIGSGKRTTLNDLIGTMGTIVGRSVSPSYQPPRVGDILHSLSDITLAKDRLAYDPEVTLQEGLRTLLMGNRAD